MPDTHAASRIDRLLLDIPGSSAETGRRVADLVAAELANVGALPQVGDVPTLRVTITADRRSDPATLARQIVTAILRELAHSP